MGARRARINKTATTAISDYGNQKSSKSNAFLRFSNFPTADAAEAILSSGSSSFEFNLDANSLLPEPPPWTMLVLGPQISIG